MKTIKEKHGTIERVKSGCYRDRPEREERAKTFVYFRSLCALQVHNIRKSALIKI